LKNLLVFALKHDGVDYEEDAYFDSVDWDIVAEKIV